jgi:hypothetical protein
MTDDERIKAWQTKAMGIASIVFAQTPAQAKHVTVTAAKRVGYTCSYAEVQVARLECYDKMIAHGEVIPKKCYDESYILDLFGVTRSTHEQKRARQPGSFEKQTEAIETLKAMQIAKET